MASLMRNWTWRRQRSTLECIVLSCLGCCNKRPSRNIMLNIYWSRNQPARIRSPFSSMVSAHTIVCVYVLCTHYVCVLRPSADSAVCVQARNRRCSKINLCICTSVYKFNIDELLLKLLAKRCGGVVWHTSCICPFRCLAVSELALSVSAQALSVLALFTQNRTQRACTERSCLSRPNAF